MADLQSAALATWLRSLLRKTNNHTLWESGPFGQALPVGSTLPKSPHAAIRPAVAIASARPAWILQFRFPAGFRRAIVARQGGHRYSLRSFHTFPGTAGATLDGKNSLL